MLIVHNRRNISVAGRREQLRVSGAIWNLIAAILCAIAAGLTAIAAVILCLDNANFVNVLAAVAGVIGTAGGVAWIAAAVIGVRQT